MPHLKWMESYLRYHRRHVPTISLELIVSKPHSCQRHLKESLRGGGLWITSASGTCSDTCLMKSSIRDSITVQSFHSQWRSRNSSRKSCLRFRSPVLPGVVRTFSVLTCACCDSRFRRISSNFSCFLISFLIWSFWSFCFAACSMKFGYLAFRPLRLVTTWASSGLKSGSCKLSSLVDILIFWNNITNFRKLAYFLNVGLVLEKNTLKEHIRSGQIKFDFDSAITYEIHLQCKCVYCTFCLVS